jgi:hypothetical protein
MDINNISPSTRTVEDSRMHASSSSEVESIQSRRSRSAPSLTLPRMRGRGQEVHAHHPSSNVFEVHSASHPSPASGRGQGGGVLDLAMRTARAVSITSLVSMFATTRNALRCVFALTTLVALSACSGGASTQQNADTNATIQSVTYSGPAPTSADIQAFKNEFWVNVVTSSRCGGCHNETKGQAPEFARSDDVNQAYAAALQVVNLSQPDQSRIVIKVGGGHNCWTSSSSACADILTTWIRNWASASGNTGTGTQIQLTAPVSKIVGASKTFPTDAALFQTTVYPLLTQYCSRCHAPSAATPQKPYFASSDVVEAYSEVKSKVNLDTPNLSRLYLRLFEESHNCWSNCSSNATTMLNAITAFAGGIPLTQVDPTLTLSKALTMYDGTVASGGNRYETHSIARYFFKEGTGTVAHDTSGVDPAVDLSFSGSVTWSGGWGISVAPGGRAQATTTSSSKLSSRIKSSGEYTIEAWIAPANVAQEDAYVVSYAGSKTTANFALEQREYQYEALARSSKTDANGAPSLLTKATDRDAQASLQHVVLTYDPVSGRKLYVNGNFTGDTDSSGGGSLSNWDDTFALVMGNEPSGNRQWTGLIKFVAIHDRALTLDQIQQNFAAGVGERYFLLFDVASLTSVPMSYVMFEVSQYDSYAYLFNKPTFISLDPTAKPGNVEIKGIRIGINGSEAKVGQAYIPLDVTVTNANYNATTGQLLSNVGTIVGLEKGPSSDVFFLTFEKIGQITSAHDYSDKTVVSVTAAADLPARPDIGFRTFEKIDATMSKLTGVPRTTVKPTYDLVKQQLPTIADFDGFVSSHQIGIAQLGIGYCSALIGNSGLAATFFSGSGLNLSASIDTGPQRAALINTIITKFSGTGLNSQPDISSSGAMYTELDSLVTKLCSGSRCTDGSRTPIVAKAVCTTALASAVTTIQ